MDAVTRLWRRSLQVVGLARGTTAASDGGVIRTAQVLYTSMAAQSDMVPFMQHYGFASRPHAGCDYLTLSLSGDFGRATIVASNDQRYRLSLEEGEAGMHDDQGQSFVIGRNVMTVKHKSGSIFSLNEDGSITLAPANGIVRVVGQITGSGNAGVGMAITGTIGATGDVTAGVGGTNVSLLNHQQQNGGGTGLSGPPAPGT